MLTDETKIGDVIWGQLKFEAMEEEFDLDDPDYSFSDSDKELLKKLIELQTAQGDMAPLESEDNKGGKGKKES